MNIQVLSLLKTGNYNSRRAKDKEAIKNEVRVRNQRIGRKSWDD